MTRIRAVSGISSLCLLAAVSMQAAQPAHAAARSTAAATGSELLVQSIRAKFGLDASLVSVRRAAQDPRATRASLGVPLTPAEAADIEGRIALGPALGKVQDAAARRPTFGGLWIDQAAGGVVKVLTTNGGSSPAVDPDLRSLLPAAADVVAVPAKHSFAELSAVADALSNAAAAHDAIFGGGYVGSGVAVSDNNVSLVLLAGTPATVADAVTARFGASVAITYTATLFGEQAQTPQSVAPVKSPTRAIRRESTPANRNNLTGPLYGGAWLSNGGPVSGGNCTVGYSHIFNSQSQWYSVTAGHCGNGTYYEGRNRQGDVIGAGHANNFSVGGSGNCDCVAVGPLTGNKPTNLWLTDGNATNTYTGTAASYSQGQLVCLSGAQSADTNNEKEVCGTINNASYTFTSYQGYTLQDAVTVNFKPQEGDSGAPYRIGRAFAGIHSAFNAGLNEGAMSKAKYIASAFSATLKYS